MMMFDASAFGVPSGRILGITSILLFQWKTLFFFSCLLIKNGHLLEMFTNGLIMIENFVTFDCLRSASYFAAIYFASLTG